MSHFDVEKVGAPSDPTQRTLTDYILSGNVLRKNVGNQSSLEMDTNGCCMMHGEEPCLFEDGHQTSRDSLDGNHLVNLDDSKFTLGNFDEREEVYESTSSVNAEMVCVDVQNEDNVQGGVSPLLAAGHSFSGQFEGSTLDRVNNVTNNREDVARNSVSQKELLLWLNDYKCSICGIEMPASFVEERQEHFDFHLAEKLQKEESGADSTCMLGQRYGTLSFAAIICSYPSATNLL